MARLTSLFIVIAIGTAHAQAPPTDPALLTIDRIFASNEFSGDGVPSLKWLKNGAYIKLSPSKTIKGSPDIVRIDKAGKSKTLIPAEALILPKSKTPLSIHGYKFSDDLDTVLIYTNSRKVWRSNSRGDYWTYRRSSKQLSKVGNNAAPSKLMFAKLSPDATRVGYVYDNNLYVEPVGGGNATKLTDDGSANIINGTFDWVYEEEFFCRDGWRWSNDGKQIAYWQLNTTGVKNFMLINNTIGKYPVITTFPYPKAGEPNSNCRVGVVSSSGGKTEWLAIPGNTRTDYYIPRMEWTTEPNELVIQRVNRLQNSIDVYIANTKDGTLKSIHTERDGAWVDLRDDSLQWVYDGREFTWLSERDGWRHLYRITRDGSTSNRITNGEYDIINVLHVDNKNAKIYFTASPDNPTQCYLYSINLDGTGTAERLSPSKQSGWHSYNISDDGSYAVHTFSEFGTPSISELIALPDHKLIRTFADNQKLKDKLAKLAQTPVEFFRVDIGDGNELDGWMMKPTHFDPKKKYPILFHIYGEPAGQTVTDRWGGRNYLWHLMLTQQGYIVASIDNRGTPAPRGREWRKCVYRKIGTLVSDDQANALRQLLKSHPSIDADRVGVWGWSGGGSMTLNLLFRHPQLYHTGMSVAPVPDVHLYDTIYQERYMGLPRDNGHDYVRTSPITHAKGLQGNLLIVHGTGDDNCHYQGTQMLVDKLIEYDKPFTLMSYPNRSHGIYEGENTTRHLYSLLTRYLLEQLPAGPR